MPDTSYQVVPREDGSFAVEIIRVGSLPQTAIGFPTEAAARGWIAQDQRLYAGVDPFRSAAERRWRGV
jgi:hypothetical protein